MLAVLLVGSRFMYKACHEWLGMEPPEEAGWMAYGVGFLLCVAALVCLPLLPFVCLWWHLHGAADGEQKGGSAEEGGLKGAQAGESNREEAPEVEHA